MMYVLSIWTCSCGARLKAIGYLLRQAPPTLSPVVCHECSEVALMDFAVEDVYWEARLGVWKVLN